MSIVGIDNNLRAYFFGSDASTEWSRQQLEKQFKNSYKHENIDVRDHKNLEKIASENNQKFVQSVSLQSSFLKRIKSHPEYPNTRRKQNARKLPISET